MTAAAPASVGDRPLLGVLLMLGFCVLAPVHDALAKLLGDTVSLALLLAVRYGMQALVLVPFCLLTGRPLGLSPRLLRLTALRTLLHVAALGTFFAALRYLPLADAVAIAFVMPFILLLLGRFALGEEVGPHRLAACAVGFLGTLMVIQPSFAAVGAPALLAARDRAPLRALHAGHPPDRPGGRPGDAPGRERRHGDRRPRAPRRPRCPPACPPPSSGADWLLLLVMGVLGTVAHLLMTWSLRFAPSATLAPMQYLEIPFATLLGWLVFGDLPERPRRPRHRRHRRRRPLRHPPRAPRQPRRPARGPPEQSRLRRPDPAAKLGQRAAHSAPGTGEGARRGDDLSQLRPHRRADRA